MKSHYLLHFVFKKHIFKKSDNINLKHYSVYSTYVDEDERAAGGSTLPVRDNILHIYVNLNTDLQAVAVRITLDKTITLCSVYIPPNASLSLTQLKYLVDQLPTPFIIMGDFNGHNPLWGSKTTTDKGKNLKNLSPRKNYVSLTTVLIHIYILGMDLIQLLILLLLIYLFF